MFNFRVNSSENGKEMKKSIKIYETNQFEKHIQLFELIFRLVFNGQMKYQIWPKLAKLLSSSSIRTLFVIDRKFVFTTN